MIISYDDSDGWYDHVTGPVLSASATPLNFLAGPGNCGTPQPGAFAARCGYGPRLPLVVISPWAKVNFVDHTMTDQSSSLRFIEKNWDLGFIDGPAAPTPGQASFDRIAGTLDNMFDFDRPAQMRPLILNPSPARYRIAIEQAMRGAGSIANHRRILRWTAWSACHERLPPKLRRSSFPS